MIQTLTVVNTSYVQDVANKRPSTQIDRARISVAPPTYSLF